MQKDQDAADETTSDESHAAIHPLDEEVPSEPVQPKRAVLVFAVLVAAGVLTGFLVTSFTAPQAGKTISQKGSKATRVKKTAGVKDEKLFKDKVEGVLRPGGIDGEGEYHLERPGGESQNVYLTSTTVDLSQYEGQKVSVWGQTFSAEAAGWFMEVGYLEVL